MARIIGHGHSYSPAAGGVMGTASGHVRSGHAEVTYEGVNATEIFERCMISMAYTDEAYGKSDRVSITAENVDGRWGNGWYPQMYDKVEAAVVYTPTDAPDMKLPCGTLYVDDIRMEWPARTITFEALSKPTSTDFTVTKKSKTWSAVTLRQIASEISGSAGLTLVFDAEDTEQIASLEQSKADDCAFLKSTAEKYGKKFKVYSDRIVIYDIATYEARESVATFTGDNTASVRFASSAQGTYTGAHLSYTASGSSSTLDVSVGGGDRILYLNESATSEAEALKKAKDSVNDANRKATTVSVTLTIPTLFPAASVVTLQGFGGAIDGRYFVTQVSYSLSGSGLQQSFQAYRIPDLI